MDEKKAIRVQFTLTEKNFTDASKFLFRNVFRLYYICLVLGLLAVVNGIVDSILYREFAGSTVFIGAVTAAFSIWRIVYRRLMFKRGYRSRQMIATNKDTGIEFGEDSARNVDEETAPRLSYEHISRLFVLDDMFILHFAVSGANPINLVVPFSGFESENDRADFMVLMKNTIGKKKIKYHSKKRDI